MNLKAEYPRFHLNEIANIVYVHSGRKPDVRTVRGILEASALPLKIVRLFDPYHEIPDGRERRIAVVSLHSSGWIGGDGLSVEYAGQTLSRYDVSLSSKRVQRSTKRLLEDVSNPRLFATRYGRS